MLRVSSIRSRRLRIAFISSPCLVEPSLCMNDTATNCSVHSSRKASTDDFIVSSCPPNVSTRFSMRWRLRLAPESRRSPPPMLEAWLSAFSRMAWGDMRRGEGGAGAASGSVRAWCGRRWRLVAITARLAFVLAQAHTGEARGVGLDTRKPFLDCAKQRVAAPILLERL